MTSEALTFDEHGRASLDGIWDFLPQDVDPAEALGCPMGQIRVPGLWEAQGHLELDGIAWYRRRFDLADADGCFSLGFGAVMDISEVWLNGVRLGGHDNPFTPFSLDPSAVLVAGTNVLTVRVWDPPVDDPEHLRLAHGKQGWANHVFPSRPSLYLTYGGIWQPVELRTHGPVVVLGAFVNGDPAALSVQVDLDNRSDRAVPVRLRVTVVGRTCSEDVVVDRGGSSHRIFVGPTMATRWSPGNPVRHQARVEVEVDGTVSDGRTVTFGLRTIEVDGGRLLLNGEPFRMKSVLVQGFRADSLYAEGDRASIEAEVRSALAMGFNTVRLHIKAFDPTYLDVCDSLGLLVHSDVPVAEPIAHEEMGAAGDSLLATRSVQAVSQQVERDRNHPSIILWSVMNELCLDRLEARAWPRYERFARALVAAARRADPTRPIIENDWVEPSPDRVFDGDVLTAHWYGRLHREYLHKIDEACAAWAALDRPLLVTEFGDWGLPAMPDLADPPFWDTRSVYAAGLAATLWPGSLGRFIVETHRYQGLSDRLQAEVFRRHDNVAGYCLTELTDVPHELNGLLDLHRRPKPLAVREVTTANQVVLPMLQLDSLVLVAGEPLTASLHVANDGPLLEHVEVHARFGDTGAPVSMEGLLELDTSTLEPEHLLTRFESTGWAGRVRTLDAHRAARLGRVRLHAPAAAGSHDLVVRLSAGGECVAENRYPVHVVAAPDLRGVAVHLLGGPAADVTGEALRSLGAEPGDAGPAVVAEGGLDAESGAQVADLLERGQVVVVLAQAPTSAAHFPGDIRLEAVETQWGSSVFHFTTDHGALPSLPRRNLLVAEDSTIQALSVVTRVGDAPFPDTPVVIAFKPVPDGLTGTIVGSTAVGPGRLVLCQYRLVDAAAAGDPAARAVLADIVRWAAVPRPVLRHHVEASTPGRPTVSRYWHHPDVAR